MGLVWFGPFRPQLQAIIFFSPVLKKEGNLVEEPTEADNLFLEMGQTEDSSFEDSSPEEPQNQSFLQTPRAFVNPFAEFKIVASQVQRLQGLDHAGGHKIISFPYTFSPYRCLVCRLGSTQRGVHSTAETHLAMTQGKGICSQ